MPLVEAGTGCIRALNPKDACEKVTAAVRK